MATVLAALALLGSQVALYVAALAAGLDWKGRRPVPPEARFDVVVVLGCRVGPDGRAGAALARRAQAGARLVLDGRARRLVLSGGRVGSDTSEASAALPHALAAGLGRGSIDLEERSRTTAENAAEVARMLGAPERAVLLVTDAYHVPRSVRLFRKHFAKVAGHGVVGAGPSRLRGALREACVLTAYLAQGKLD
jgi:uncharacterized SAM-binding protein YcdF (DUF218 family)